MVMLASVISLAYLLCSAHCSRFTPSDLLTERQQPTCISDAEISPSTYAAIQPCQDQGLSAICWPPNGSSLCYPRSHNFYWSPTYFRGRTQVGVFLEDPQPLTYSEISVRSHPNRKPAFQTIPFDQTDYDTSGPTHTFHVWAVGSSLGGDPQIAENPSIYTLVYSPAPSSPVPTSDTTGQRGNDDDGGDGISSQVITVIIVVAIFCLCVLAFFSFCCCGCCRGIRNRTVYSRPLYGFNTSSRISGIPFYQPPSNEWRGSEPRLPVAGIPRARLTDPRRLGAHEYFEEQLPPYRKTREGEDPPAYEQPSNATNDNPVGGSASTQHENNDGGSSETNAGQHDDQQEVHQRSSDSNVTTQRSGDDPRAGAHT